MNLALDLANYNLKTHLHSFAQSVVTNTHVDFEAFKKAYPDDLSCMRHLQELKSQKGFFCKMCGNTKSFKGKATFDVHDVATTNPSQPIPFFIRQNFLYKRHFTWPT